MTKPVIENDFQQKYMLQKFAEPVALSTPADVRLWKAAWEDALKQWHSPYKVMVDCSHISVTNPDLVKDLKLMTAYFKGFFMRSIIGFGLRPDQGQEFLPFEVKATEEEARVALQIRERLKTSKGSDDFRATIFLENHFQQQSMELSFTDHVKLDSAEKLEMLKAKLTNNLNQWHSPWNLLIDCTNLEYDPALDKKFNLMVRFFNGFFLRQVMGYQPHSPQSIYPFKVYRSRHRAAAELEATANISGDTANCASRK